MTSVTKEYKDNRALHLTPCELNRFNHIVLQMSNSKRAGLTNHSLTLANE